ncbi:VOC family protein [Halioglobus maricola]|uniref:VOC family protein n=1 Tax=Halioglobus maricola TaxID=2601894 RepID=A0A5P9NEU8_9GAMM|nr:VOC family protein [Halioglobus maricola]QFU74261.1 VOC family protein [Halioglobus maricola]
MKVGYVTLGTNDLEKACAFYDALMGEVGFSRIWDDGKLIVWGPSLEEASVGVTTPFNDEAASIGNGVMVALQAENEEQVKAFYNKALELGATDEGPPGQRIDNFYAGYFRDLDGNKLNAFCFNAVTL